ncbi:MAG: 2-haloacid dehalogenase [Candidatus Latescibacterota bacterium]|jgi:2-haloacid dehalogenase
MTVKALTFDVFGTVVDWRSAIIRDGERLGKTKGLDVDWVAFADAWRAGYGPAMNRVRKGELPWTKIDHLHRIILDEILDRFKISGLSEDEKVELNFVWHRLDPWPDSVGGLLRLKSKFLIATLSNGNVSLLANMAKYGGLPWDCILSAELAHHYKPDPETYLTAAAFLSCEPQEVMMVAAHQGDLRAAAKVGMKTAFVMRPFEHGREADVDLTPDPDFDYVAQDFHDLADKLNT